MSIGNVPNGQILTTEELQEQLGLKSHDRSAAVPNAEGNLQEYLLRQASGYVIREEGRGSREEYDENDPRNPRYQQQQAARAASLAAQSTSITVNGVRMGYDDVVSNLGKSIDLQSQTLQKPMHEVRSSDMLHVDAQGRVVSADHPEARPVDTQEEKLAIEDQNRACYAGITVEDITMGPDGKLVLSTEMEQRSVLESNLEETSQALKDLEAGRIKMEELPLHIQEQIADIQQGKTPDALTEPVAIIDGVIFDLPNRAIALEELKDHYKPPAPAPVPTPATPGM